MLSDKSATNGRLSRVKKNPPRTTPVHAENGPFT
jgi:hypothetical protein